MWKIFPSTLIVLMLVSCAPALKQEYLERGDTNVSFQAFLGSPDSFKGRLYILGGLIAETSPTAEGSLVEALYIPVDSDGHLMNSKGIDGRFLALLPKGKGALDPKVYSERRAITIAGEFTGLKPGRIDEMEYIYPVFEIKDIRLWKEIPLSSLYAPYPEAGPYTGPSLLRDPFWKDRQKPAWR